MENENAFKHRIGPALVERLAAATSKAWPSFETGRFVDAVLPRLPPLELKARVELTTRTWADYLPQTYPVALPIVLATMGAPLGEGASVSEGLFYHWVHAAFVQSFGLEHLELSLEAMVQITQRATSEFCVRPFLLRYPRPTLAFLERQRGHESPHVRRWVSEGTRPRLPWGMRLATFVADPSPVLALIAPLRADPSEYVRNSVANNLNDIAKDHADVVVETVASWLLETHNPHAPWIAKRALRPLVKQGHPGALKVLGFGAGARVELATLRVDKPSVTIGDAITLQLQLVGRQAENLCIDYAVTFQMANGKTGSKVFKLKALQIDKGQSMTLRKRHSFRPITTRTYYAGEHTITILANGIQLGRVAFLLRVPK